MIMMVKLMTHDDDGKMMTHDVDGEDEDMMRTAMMMTTHDDNGHGYGDYK